MAESNFLELDAIKVNQPLGAFYVMAISAKDLLQISFSEPLKYVDGSGKVKGSQRKKDEKRLVEIAKYIESVEMAFPNTIILAANYTQLGFLTKDETERWRVEQGHKSSTFKIIVPKELPLAAIIDGQHRLNAFEYVKTQSRFDDLQLLCSVYFDLPNSYQAFLFATINSNQKKVDRSLALEQFGYNVDDEPEKAWTPEKLAVFLSRRLNVDKDRSPFYSHIRVAPLNIDALLGIREQVDWVISTATVVDGIMSLISSNPKRDRLLMQQTSILSGRSRSQVKEVKDSSPLRHLFLEIKDQVIYDTVINYFSAVNGLLWQKASDKSYIKKTVGVQALFDILKMILQKDLVTEHSTAHFSDILKSAELIDFSDKFFQASGIGKSRIKNSIGLAMGAVSIDRLKEGDQQIYNTLIKGGTSQMLQMASVPQEAAEQAILSVLDKSQWNYDSKSITVVGSEASTDTLTFTNQKHYSEYLRTVAVEAFENALPEDPETADKLRDDFNFQETFQAIFFTYEHNFNDLGWGALSQN